MVGSGKAHFPADRAERVAMQVALVEHVAGSEKHLLSFAHDFCNAGQNSISAHYERFATTVLQPLLRDLGRLAENRVVPPVLLDVMGSLPASGDALLDQLLLDAIGKFKEVAPAVRKEGLERLWDAWERLKSTEDSRNKRLSVTALLDRAAPDGPFRDVLDDEAQRLTRVGNEFHIRHFEAGKIAFERDSYVDYLFHRLFALIHLLL